MVTCETIVVEVSANLKPSYWKQHLTIHPRPVAVTSSWLARMMLLRRCITSKVRTSRVVVSTLPHRHDLPAKELCEKHRGTEVLQFNNIGRGAFTQHGMHLNRNTKHLLCLRKMHSTASRATSQPPVTARGPQNNEQKSDQTHEYPTAPLPTTLQPPAASELHTLQYESFAEAVKCRSPVRQVGPSSTITDTTEQNTAFFQSSSTNKVDELMLMAEELHPEIFVVFEHGFTAEIIIITGNFNIDVLDHTNPLTQRLRDILTSLGLIWSVNSPTRVTSTSSTAIDNVITNVIDCSVSVIDLRPSQTTTHRKP
ncbi:hypothetical protein J6590_078675 [Homalodisca vitripennis]|nr:hypothetical protein J6590_078675 [Homalodisca vitripennis]